MLTRRSINRLRAHLVLADNNIYFVHIFRDQMRPFCRRISAANKCNGLSGIDRPITRHKMYSVAG